MLYVFNVYGPCVEQEFSHLCMFARCNAKLHVLSEVMQLLLHPQAAVSGLRLAPPA